jgi:hypothetical protein
VKNIITVLFFFLLALTCNAQSNINLLDSSLGKRVFKADFTAPITGNVTVGYEQVVGKNITLDFKLGIIGIGIYDYYYDNTFGAFLKAGPCLYIVPNYGTDRNENFSLLQGTYIKPTLAFSTFSFDNEEYQCKLYCDTPFKEKRIVQTTTAILLDVGHQFVFKKTIAFNFYTGFGYGFSLNHFGWYDQYQFAYYKAGGDVVTCVDGGVEIGLVFKK